MMEPEEKVKCFQRELNMIRDEDFRNECTELVKNIPEDFFSKPASSTKKYHPLRASDDGGLLWHTRFAFWIAIALTKKGAVFSFLTQDQRDVGLAAIIFHDTMKYGFDGGRSNKGYTYFEHPLMVDELVRRVKGRELDQKTNRSDMLLSTMIQVIKPHMGSWNSNNRSKITLPVPETKLEKFIHYCDFMSSVEFMNFDEDSIDRFIVNNK